MRSEARCQSFNFERAGSPLSQMHKEGATATKPLPNKSLWSFGVWARAMRKRSDSSATEEVVRLRKPLSDLKDFASVADFNGSTESSGASSADSSGASTCSEELATVAVSQNSGPGESVRALQSPAPETALAVEAQGFTGPGDGYHGVQITNCNSRGCPRGFAHEGRCAQADWCGYAWRQPDCEQTGSVAPREGVPAATGVNSVGCGPTAHRRADQLHCAACLFAPPSSPSTCAVDQDQNQRSPRAAGSLWCFGWGRSWRRRLRPGRRRAVPPPPFYQTPKDSKQQVLVVSLSEAQDFCALDQSGSLSFKSLRSRMGSSGSVCGRDVCFAGVTQRQGPMISPPSGKGAVERLRSSRGSEGLLSFLKASSWGNSFSRDLSRSRSKIASGTKSDFVLLETTAPSGDPTYHDDASEFFSVEGDNFDWEGLTNGLLGREESSCSTTESPAKVTTKALPSEAPRCDRALAPCSCGYPCHLVVYDERMPLHTGPNVVPDSYEERLAIARALRGHWITIVERSESLDGQYKLLGLGMVKRAVMNRLAVPLTMFLEHNDTVLHCWIHTPLGIRHMCSNLEGKESIDDDPDAGRWIGTTATVLYSVPWYCGGKPVRALQQTRHNPKIGTSIETRCVLPDPEHGKIMLFNFLMYPKGKPESAKLTADRILYLESENV